MLRILMTGVFLLATATVDAREPSAVGGKKISRRMQSLKRRIEQTVRLYEKRLLNTRDHNSWEVMHAVIGFGVASVQQVAPSRPT